MSQPQEQHPEPNSMLGSSQSTSTNVMQVPPNLSMAFSDDRVMAAAIAPTQSNMNHVVLPPSPPLQVPPKKGRVTWTEEEHKLFLIGLNEFGKGAWKDISRKSVLSKTPSQVASHAQKYFIHKDARKKKRKSIHDITLDEYDHILLSGSFHHHNLDPLPQNHGVEIASQELNHDYIDHENLIFHSHNGCLNIQSDVTNSNQALVPHYTNRDNWAAPIQNMGTESMQFTTIPNSIDHQNRVAPIQNLDTKPMLPTINDSIDHQNLFDLLSSPDTEAIQLPTIPHSNDHQNWLAPLRGLDTEAIQLPTIPHSNDHQTSISSPPTWNLPLDNLTNPNDIEFLQEQQPLSSLSPNNLPPHHNNDEYQYLYDIDMFDSDMFNSLWK